MLSKKNIDGDILVSGGRPKGADRFCKKLHLAHHLPYLEFPANWEEHGRGAGFIRNSDIAEVCDILIACVSSDRKGGTEDTIKKFIKIHGESHLILI